MNDPSVDDALQQVIKDVFAKRGEMAGDAIVIVEVIENDGQPVLWSTAGNLARWNAVGYLEYMKELLLVDDEE